MDTITIENRQDAITVLNMLIRRELTDKADIQAVLEKIREAIEHYKI
jgi:hypothetical protein